MRSVEIDSLAVLSLFNSSRAIPGKTAGEAAELAFDCCRRILASVANNVVEAQAEPTAAHRAQLQLLLRGLANPSEEALDQLCTTLDRELSRWSSYIREFQEDRERDLREIIQMTGEATAVVSSQNDQYTDRLRSFGHSLQSLAKQNSLLEVRRGLSSELTVLRQHMEEMRAESDSAVQRLENQMMHFQQRLMVAEELAATDALTGALNRRGGEAKLQQMVERGATFALLMFDLNRFKQVNDTWGHAAGDQVLRSFTERVRLVLRPADILCRWGGDEFIAMLPSASMMSDERFEEIRSRIRGFHKVVSMGKEIQVEVSAGIGLVYHEPGESVESLLLRADEALYRAKEGRQADVTKQGSTASHLGCQSTQNG